MANRPGGDLDILTAFMVIGRIAAQFAGQTTGAVFSLHGAPALVVFPLLIAYFVVGGRLGGTLRRRILGVPPRRRATG